MFGPAEADALRAELAGEPRVMRGVGIGPHLQATHVVRPRQRVRAPAGEERPQPQLDGRYTVFGEVVDGMDARERHALQALIGRVFAECPRRRATTPSERRAVNDQQVAWIDQLVDNGDMEKKFNTGLFLNGASSNPETAGLGVALIGSFFMMLTVVYLSSAHEDHSHAELTP